MSDRTLARVRGPAVNPARAREEHAAIIVAPPCDAHSRVRVRVLIGQRETWIELSTGDARALAMTLLSACDVPDAS